MTAVVSYLPSSYLHPHRPAQRIMTITSPNSSQLRGVPAAISNSELIKHLKLLQHPEGGKFAKCNWCLPYEAHLTIYLSCHRPGYYAETDRQSDEIPSPFAGTQCRSESFCIFLRNSLPLTCGPSLASPSNTMITSP